MRKMVKMPQVFISHTNAEGEFAKQLARDLQSHGLTVWSADQHIGPGDHWLEVIQDAIRDSQNILVILSRNSARSSWVEAEAAIALCHGGKRIVPVYSTKDVDVPFMLRSIQGIDLSDPETWDTALN